jgi:CBS domain-containing protein
MSKIENLDKIPVSKYMTKNVVTATVDQTIQSICRTMYESNIGSVVIVKRVVDGLIPIDIITERDIINQIGKVELFSTQSPLRELMSNKGNRDLITVTSDTQISDALSAMHSNNIRRLPIVDNREKKMIGIITDKDIFRAVLRASGITTF